LPARVDCVRWLAGILLGLILAVSRVHGDASARSVPAVNDAGLSPQPAPAGYVFDITVRNEKQLDILLSRAESLQGQFSPDQFGRIALVLHGDELRLFQKSNYPKFKNLVERARLLDASRLVDIKACQTVMRQLDIDQSELPEFIEQVPLAPEEIQRLEQEKGYTRL